MGRRSRSLLSCKKNTAVIKEADICMLALSLDSPSTLPLPCLHPWHGAAGSSQYQLHTG